jgi:hypothetical protein
MMKTVYKDTSKNIFKVAPNATNSFYNTNITATTVSQINRLYDTAKFMSICRGCNYHNVDTKKITQNTNTNTNPPVFIIQRKRYCSVCWDKKQTVR